ncbi:MAG: hypothetical protein QOJ54_2024 [Aliidongia sp.]|nr:hypothetical protein [Aliidongia sp.]
MRTTYVTGASMLALSMALGNLANAGPPGAPRVLTTNIADYNAAQATQANGILTVPDGLATYAVNAGGGSLEVNSRLTVTLPANFTFNSQPALSDTGTATFSLVAGGVGAQSAVFQVNTAPIIPGQSVTLGTFAVAGATILGTPIPVSGALPLTIQATNNALITNNDATPFSVGAFASEPGASGVYVGAIQFIDLAPPSFGSLFLSSPDTPTIVLSAAAIHAQTVDAATSTHPVLSPTGALNSLATTDTATVVIAGLFEGIQTAFASTTSDCKTVTTGTTVPAGPLQISIPDVPINGEIFFCITAGTGGTLLQQNPNGLVPSALPGTSTDFLAFKPTVEFPGFIVYTHGGVLSVGNFFTGDDAGYSSLLRVNNAGSAGVQVFVVAQPDTGGPPLIGPLATLGAGMGTVFTEPQVASATGLNLANSGQRATIQLIIGGDVAGVAASTLLVNPGGVVDNVSLATPLK